MNNKALVQNDSNKTQTVRFKTTSRCLLFVLCVLIFSTGCEQWPEEQAYYDVFTPHETTHRIENFKLTPAKDEPTEPNDANVPPPEQIELTLEESRALALENNLELKVSLISPAIAAERVSEEEAKFEALFFANSTFNKSDTPSVSFLDQITGSQWDSINTDLGVSMPLRTGGRLTFDMADARTKTDAQQTQFNPYYTSGGSLSLSQPLLRNAGTRVNTHSIRIARYEQQISDARTKLEVIRIIAAVDRVYWRLDAARRLLEVRKEEHRLARLQLEQARRFVNSGERAQVEIVRAEAGVANKLEAIILAEKSLRDRERDFKRVINKAGLPMKSPTVMIPDTKPIPIRYTLEGPGLVQQAMANRMELLELELQIAEDISTIDYAHNQTLPLVTLDYRYNVNGLGPQRHDSLDLLFDKRFESHRLGLQLQVPLGNEAAKSRLLQAFYQRRQRLASRDDRRTLVELEVLNAADQVEANWQRILASRQRTILNGRLYKAEQRQFELGLRTSTDVLLAQTAFGNAQSDEIQALAEYQISLVDLAYATGTLLGSARVDWDPIVPETAVDKVAKGSLSRSQTTRIPTQPVVSSGAPAQSERDISPQTRRTPRLR